MYGEVQFCLLSNHFRYEWLKVSIKNPMILWLDMAFLIELSHLHFAGSLRILGLLAGQQILYDLGWLHLLLKIEGTGPSFPIIK